MIRQAISCDICGAEKKQTNHWFVTYEQNGELRVSGWSSRHRLRPNSKHLCGQTCLHKLIDDFIAKTIAVRTAPPEMDEPATPASATDTSLTSIAADAGVESSIRLVVPQPTAALWPVVPSRAEPSAVPSQLRGEQIAVMAVEPPRNPRAQAWERERERSSHERGQKLTARRGL